MRRFHERRQPTPRNERASPRIVAALHTAGISGPAKTLQPRLQHLAESAELEVVLPGPGPAVRLYDAFATVTTLRFAPLTRPLGALGPLVLAGRILRDLVAFWRHFGRTRPTVVVVGSSYLPSALLAARLRGLPVCVYVGETLQPEQRLADRLLARLLASASAVVAPSVTAAAPLRDLAPVVMPPGVAAAGAPPGRGLARSHFGVPEGSFCVVAVGNLTAGRGQDTLLRAVAAVRDSGLAVFCVVAGEPNQEHRDRAFADSLRALVAQLGLGEIVRFAGVVEDIGELYAAADAVVNPARAPESFGRVAVEALAAGRPVVATSVGAIPQLLRHEQNALLVPPDDPGALVDAIQRLAGDPALGERLVDGGAEVVAACDPQAGVEAFAAVIARIAPDY